MVSAINNQTSGRKIFTFIEAIWSRRFCATLWKPAPVSHLVIRGQYEREQQPNQGWELNDVAHPANLMVTDFAALFDSARSKDKLIHPVRRPPTPRSGIHSFVQILLTPFLFK